jgi:hypothetical protein
MRLARLLPRLRSFEWIAFHLDRAGAYALTVSVNDGEVDRA